MTGLSRYQIIGPVAYIGKADCDYAGCRRQWFSATEFGPCMGYHCVYCDEPCGPMGHRCDAAEAILGEARRLIENPAYGPGNPDWEHDRDREDAA